MGRARNKASDAAETNGLRSVEHFNHFHCGACSKWWGIGDAPPGRKDWFCPWCGTKNKFGPAKRVQLIK